MASNTGRMAPPGYPTFRLALVSRGRVDAHLQMCFTSILRIISWKICPPVIPTKLPAVSHRVFVK